jgi:hypothetical protein
VLIHIKQMQPKELLSEATTRVSTGFGGSHGNSDRCKNLHQDLKTS